MIKKIRKTQTKGISNSESGKFLKGCLIALGVAALIVVILIISAVVFIQRNIAGPIKAVMEGYAETVKEYPFEPDEDSVLTEKRLQKYITVRSEILPELAKLIGTFEEMDELEEKKDVGFFEGLKKIGECFLHSGMSLKFT